MTMNNIHKNKYFLAIAAALLLGALEPIFAQITIPQSYFEFTLTEGRWKYLETVDVDANTHVYLFSSIPVVSKDNDTTLPFLRIYVKNNIGKDNSMDFAMRRFMQQPFIIVDEFSTSPYLPCKDAIGYVGLYKDDDSAKRNKFYMIYFVNKSTLVEFRLETTEESFAQKQPEFEQIMKTIKLK